MSPLSPNAHLRFDVVRRILIQTEAAGSFLEIGCGQGAAATMLARHFDYVGYEPDTNSFQTARRRLADLGAGRVVNGQLPDRPQETFNVVGAFEVLEHLEDDRAAIREWVRWLTPGGYVLVSVPAHPDRFGPSDLRVGHFRRYTRTAIVELLASADLVDIRTIAYGFPLGYLLEWVRNRIASRDPRGISHEEKAELTAESGRFLQPSEVMAPLIWAGTLPFRLLQRPFASSNLGTGWVSYGRLPR